MQRPDEGLIHAWLDGQLPPDEAARVEQLAATDAEWAAAVAEARGLIAASSRILSALDSVPAGVVPQRAAERRVRRLPWWTKAAAAVVFMVGVGSLVLQQVSAPGTAPVPVAQAVSAPVVAPTSANMPAAVQATIPPSTPTMQPPAQARAIGGVASGAASRTSEAASVSRAAGAAGQVMSDNEAGKKAAGFVARSELRVASAPPPPALTVDAATTAMQGGAQAPAPRAMMEAAHTGSTRDLQNAVDSTPQGQRQRATAMLLARDVGQRDAASERTMAVAAKAAASQPARSAASCYRVQAGDQPSSVSVVMRVMRTDGDTLRLEPAEAKSALRAWIVRHDGTAHGAMSSDAENRGSVPVTATPTTCPTP